MPSGVELVDAPVSIAKTADPANAVRTTPEASIVQATRAVAEGRAQAFVSGGSTGPALAAALFNLRRDRGVYRPALALPIPNPGRSPILLLDVGANVTCRPEHLVQFAHMGSAFAQAVLGIDAPRVALLSNGEEPGKGTPELVAAHQQLAGSRGTGLNFVGNIEGTQIFEGVADVVVMDGFTGNITLKLIEGVSSRALRVVTETAATTARGRLGNSLIGPAMEQLRESIDPEGPGGAYMLGLRQLGVVAHGRFSARGFARAIEVAARGVTAGRDRRHPDRVAGSGRAPACPGRDGPGRDGASASWRWPVRTGGYGFDAMTREEIFQVIRGHLVDELEVEPETDHRVHPLQRGPRRRLAGPLHARAGAGGFLRRADLRRAGGQDPDRRPGRRLSCSM